MASRSVSFQEPSRTTFIPGVSGSSRPSGASDDDAIAPDKEALLPGQAVTFANATSYEKGLNGIMVDLWDVRANLAA